MTGEGGQVMRTHAQRLLDSLPIREFIDRHKQLLDIANSLPAGGIDSPSHEMRQAARKLEQEQEYAPGLLRACEHRLLGQEHSYDECDLDLVLGLKAEKAMVAAPRSNSDAIAKSVKDAMAAHDKRLQDLRKEIDDYKAQIAADYAKAGKPIPVSLNVAKEQHPDTPRIRELESEASRLRTKAAGISEEDLAAYYLSKASECEGKAAELRRAAV
jgi:hypothetical protein